MSLHWSPTQRSMHSLPITPPIGAVSEVYAVTDDDLNFLSLLTAPDAGDLHSKSRYRRRDAPLDPLLLAAAASSGPHITRHHYHHHDLFLDVPEEVWDWNVWDANNEDVKHVQPPQYVSKQAPRSSRLGAADSSPEQQSLPTPSRTPSPTPAPLPQVAVLTPLDESPEAPLQVHCMARTRIPTPHGPAFLHLYKNNKDIKEHLAIVIDPGQLQSQSPSPSHIRSRTLDSKWTDSETDMDRITRGAYIGKLSPSEHIASFAPMVTATGSTPTFTGSSATLPAPLVRIHSECFTGETIGSMRCDCGEQLDEALRLISQPITTNSLTPTTIPGRGAVIYLRQEGRNIGLLSKIRAYNLQDMGHDTVTANLLLGHGADERRYDIAGAIMKDLGLDSERAEGVRLLTNNPDKVKNLEKEGIKVVERVGMVPRSWTCLPHDAHHNTQLETAPPSPETREYDEWRLRSGGATLIGSGAAHGEELNKYLRTKVERMGHLLDLSSQT